MSGDFSAADEPFSLFDDWFKDASASEINDPNGMALATAGADGLPDVRMVLLKGRDAGGFVFFSNRESAKGRQLGANMQAALLFHWKSLRRQVRVRGPVEEVTAKEADDYFATRPRGSRIGAWASQQSRPLESKYALETAVAKMTARYPIGDVPRPPYWTGFRIRPVQMEFWHDRPFRLHERIVFTRARPEDAWAKERLFP